MRCKVVRTLFILLYGCTMLAFLGPMIYETMTPQDLGISSQYNNKQPNAPQRKAQFRKALLDSLDITAVPPRTANNQEKLKNVTSKVSVNQTPPATAKPVPPPKQLQPVPPPKQLQHLTPCHSIPKEDKLDSFTTVKNNNVTTLQWLCIETKSKDPVIKLRKGTVTEKVLVVYKANSNTTSTLYVSSAPNAKPNSWSVVYRTSDVPCGHQMMSVPLYLVLPTVGYTLHEWWHDTVRGLYGAMQLTKRLGHHLPSQAVLRNPVPDKFRCPVTLKPLYSELLEVLGTRPPLEVFHALPHGNCYPYAVFGYSQAPELEVRQYIIDQYEKTHHRKCKGSQVTFIQTKVNKILNLEALKAAAHGFDKTEVLTIENTAFSKQWDIIRCSDIVVGVTGPALQWTVFLQAGKGLLELSALKAPFQYSQDYSSFQKIKTGQLLASKVDINWNSASSTCFKGKIFSKSEKEKMGVENVIDQCQAKGILPFSIIDLEFDVSAFNKTLSQLRQRIL